jgi:hypothetical protein
MASGCLPEAGRFGVAAFLGVGTGVGLGFGRL